MSDNINPTVGFFNSMPDWLKAIVMVMVAPFLAIALAGLVLQINVNEYLDRYFDIQMVAMQQSLDGLSSDVQQVIDDHFIELEGRITQTEVMVLDNVKRIELLESWACRHSDVQDLSGYSPIFCP